MSSSTIETPMVRRAGVTSDSGPTALATPVKQGSTWIASRGRLRRDVKELRALDDRILCDIGLSRGEVEYATRRPRESALARSGSNWSCPCLDLLHLRHLRLDRCGCDGRGGRGLVADRTRGGHRLADECA